MNMNSNFGHRSEQGFYSKALIAEINKMAHTYTCKDFKKQTDGMFVMMVS